MDDDNEFDSELIEALILFGRNQTDTPNRELFNEVILTECAFRGHFVCQLCGCTLRDHVLRALRKGAALEHKFTAEHQL